MCISANKIQKDESSCENKLQKLNSAANQYNVKLILVVFLRLCHCCSIGMISLVGCVESEVERKS